MINAERNLYVAIKLGHKNSSIEKVALYLFWNILTYVFRNIVCITHISFIMYSTNSWKNKLDYICCMTKMK